MKRIIFIVALAALCLSAAAQGTPPIRGDFSAPEISSFVEQEWNATGDAAGSARRMFDAFDASYNLREALIKRGLKGQQVYWEQYALHSSIIVHRADSSEAQDFHMEGAARKTGYSFKTRDTDDGITYYVRTEFMDEGFVSIWNLFQSFDSSRKKDEVIKNKHMSGEGGIQIWYTPLKVHIKSTEKVFPVYEGCTGAMDFYLSDLQDRWAIDGYTFKITSMNPEIFTVEQSEVTTDGEGKGHIRIHGGQKGKGRLRIYIYLAEPDNNCYVQVEEYYDVEVLEAEKWSYTMSVHDQFTLPAHDYTMNGKFSVAGSLDENDVPQWKMFDITPVSRSGGGTFHTQGEFINPDKREDGVVFGFDVQGILNRTQGAVGAQLGILAEAIQFMETGQAQTTDSKNVITSMLTTLEEGSWPYYFNIKSLDQFGGAGISSEEIEAKMKEEQQKQEEEQAKKDKKKSKKKGFFKELREGIKALNELKNFEMPDLKLDLSQTNPEALGTVAYTPEQAAAKAAQVAYIKEHHCIVIPDLTQMLLPHFGNDLEEIKKSGPTGDVSWKEIRGTLTLQKEK